MTALTRRWNEYWYGPGSGTDLAVCRLLFFGYLLYKDLHLDTSRWSEFVPELWFPMPLFQALHLALPSPGALHGLDAVWKVSLGLSCLGLFTRASSFVAFVLGFYLMGVPHNFGKVHHSDAQLIFILAALAFSRAGDHLSLDAWLARRRGRPAAPAHSGEYRWPVRLAWLTWILVYFSAGLAKLRESGLSWLSGGDMSNRLLLHQVTHAPPTEWGLWVATQPALCVMVACLALGTELSSPLALVSARARAIFIPGLGLMQLGIWLLMGVKFGGFVAAYIFWLPWTAGYRWLRRAGHGPA